ncbi:MAG: A/G-specific adenine glycosylase, partial [Polyangiaceae bacterium]
MTKAPPPASSTSTEKAAKFRRPRRSPQHHAYAAAGAQPGPDPTTVRLLHSSLLNWYAGARRDLPWRRTRDPYAIWLSEVMLQQTRVETVVPYYERFLARWPTVRALAEAPLDDVLGAWSGLGYYRRARMLHAAAGAIAEERAFPPDAESLARVKGIGRYTAGAVASIAYGEAAPLVDGNVARVFARLFAIEEDVRAAKGIERLWGLAEELVHAGDPGSWNQALMELGATVCTPREPRCLVCPVRDACRARALGIERELPRLKAKAKPQVEQRWALVATDGGSVVLGQRRAELRFGGMWEPPSVRIACKDGDEGTQETERQAAARLSALTGARLAKVRRGGEVTHVLSHRRLEVSVLVAELVSPALSAGSEDTEYARFEIVELDRLEGRG